jgi:hypothetical protein
MEKPSYKLSSKDKEALHSAFEHAKQRLYATNDEGLPAQAITPVTQFKDKQNDISLQYDYNKDPASIPPDVETKLRFIMQVVQQQATNKLVTSGKDFTHDPEVWIQFFARYPLLFNFQSRTGKKIDESNFTLSVNSDLVNAVIDPASPQAIKAAFIQALRDNSNAVLTTTTKTTDLQYLTFVRSYAKASAITIYRAVLHEEVNTVKTFCAGGSSINLHVEYDEVVFEINNELALALYPSLSKISSRMVAKYLSEFFVEYAKQEFSEFEKWLDSLGR